MKIRCWLRLAASTVSVPLAHREDADEAGEISGSENILADDTVRDRLPKEHSNVAGGKACRDVGQGEISGRVLAFCVGDLPRVALTCKQPVNGSIGRGLGEHVGAGRTGFDWLRR